MDFLDKRITVITDELKRLRTKQKFPLSTFQYKEGNFIRPLDADNDKAKWETFDTATMHWFGKDRHYWFRTSFTVPKELDGKSMWLHIQTQIDEWDDAKNPQFLLFVNGEIVQGIDMNHRDVLLSDCAKEGEELLIELQAYSGILHSEFNLIAYITEIDNDITSLYYDILVPLQSFTRMERDSKVRMDIENVLNNTINYLDLRNPYSQEFYGSLKVAKKYIQKALYTDMAGYSDVIASCIGHTHIDVAWWWTVAQTREKVARSFATVLKLMDEYPNYKFMSSQPQLYFFLKERYPELYEKVKMRVKEGRWEAEGGMWLEADCNLTSGESLARQFIHGKRFFKEEFGVDNKILWLPDVFGYSGALPQIMKKSGIEYFMTTKLAWNQFNKVPYDTMRWRGIDGTEILTHLITTLGVHQSVKDFFTTYNGILHPDAIMGGWERYQNKDINNDILVAFGYGDGGGGPTREMLETSLRMEKGIKGIPKVRQVFSRTYFDELKERVKDNKRLPVWEGEFYFEYHRGTYTSMARNKRGNRKSELGLMDAELFSVMAENRVKYPKMLLDKMWKTVLLNQFHDILPGSSIKEVYEVTKKEYKEISENLTKIIDERKKAIVRDGKGISVFNTTGKDRNDIVILPSLDASCLIDESGNKYPVQKCSEGSICYLVGLPSKGYKTFSKGEEKFENKITINNSDIETPYYKVKINDKGFITSIFDKENEREVIKEKSEANMFVMYEDKPIYYDNWDIDIYYTEKSWDITDLSHFEWIEKGPVRATLLIERRVSNSFIRQKIHFYASSRRIDFETYVDWKEHQCLLKVHFPVLIHSDEATFDVQFGNLKRKIHTNTSWDKARFESCGQKWIDFSEGHYGVSLLNDCKYGHSVKDSNLALTLIKSGIEPNPTTDQEEHFFTYSLLPHKGGWMEGGTVSEAYNLNQPCIVEMSGREGDVFSFAQVDKENIILETVKKAECEEATIFRLYECENSLTTCHLTVNTPFSKAYSCNLLEEEEEELEIKGNVITFKAKPYEIITIKIK